MPQDVMDRGQGGSRSSRSIPGWMIASILTLSVVLAAACSDGAGPSHAQSPYPTFNDDDLATLEAAPRTLETDLQDAPTDPSDPRVVDDDTSMSFSEHAIAEWPMSPVVEVIRDRAARELVIAAYEGTVNTELSDDLEWEAVQVLISDSPEDETGYRAYAEFVSLGAGGEDIGNISAVVATDKHGKLKELYLLDPGERDGIKLIYYIGFVRKGISDQNKAIRFTVPSDDGRPLAAAVLPFVED